VRAGLRSSDEIRDTLSIRLVDTTMVLVGLCILSAFHLGTNWSDRAILFGIIVLFMVSRTLLKRSLQGAQGIFLGLGLCALTLFDDGFSGNSSTWVLQIPVALGIWIVIDPPRTRIFWFAIQLATLSAVNFTTWTPQMNRRLVPPGAISLHIINLGGSIALCLFIIRFLQQQHERALQEAREQTLAAETASRAREEFFSHMSHELRTPLNAIQGFAELSLQDRSLAADLAENLQSILLSAEHLSHLANDILDLARLGNGTLQLSCEGFDPAACMDETLTMLRPLAQEKRLALLSGGWSEIPRIRGDRIRWKQIILNLGANGIKFTSEGRIEFRARWTPSGERSGLLQLEVQDTGPGISAEDQKKIFERFQRGSAATNTAGTGLGLAISRSLAHAMGGEISLVSSPGKGSTFQVGVPFEIADPSDGDQTRHSLQALKMLSGLHILVAEDNRTNIRLATQVLDRLNATSDVAEDGGKAIEMLSRRRYDLLLLDLHMPVLDGFEVVRLVRDPRSAVLRKDTPILALTADAFEETLARVKSAGLDDCMVKPFRMAELADRILRLVG
jgi:signal transduction histidine kinase/CheY-like chemotaxis protein